MNTRLSLIIRIFALSLFLLAFSSAGPGNVLAGTTVRASLAPNNGSPVSPSASNIDHENVGSTIELQDITCDALTLSHNGNGSDPSAVPTSSPGCDAGLYLENESISLIGANPETGWEISAWTGTEDDTSTASSNAVIMPVDAHSASVTYSMLAVCYTLTIGKSGNGTTPTPNIPNSPDCPEGQYVEGASITLSGADPDPGWQISGWTGTIDDNSTAISNIVNMPGQNHSATVVYTQPCYTLTIGKSGNGTTPTANPSKSDACASDGQYVEGASITLSGATPDPGWQISSWIGTTNNSGTGTSNTVQMPGNNHSAGVNYTQPCYILTIGHSGNGTTPTPNPTNSPDCPEGQYVEGASITLSGADPDPGWQISGWTGTQANNSTASSNTVQMPGSNHSASVVYTQPCYTLTLGHSGNGTTPTANPSKSDACASDGQYVEGASITLSGATPDPGWQISSWSGTINNSSTASNNTVTMPGGNHSAGVNYTQPCYTMTLTHTGNGTTPTPNPTNSTNCPSGQYVEGASITLSGATPDPGWYISSWTGTTNNTSTASTNTVIMPGSNHSAGVNYTQNQYSLTVISAHGTVTRNHPGPYVYGDVVQLQAEPNLGWAFVNWSGDHSSTSNPTNVTITGDMTVTANYSQNQYTLTVGISGSGSVTQNPDQETYVHGTTVQLTAVPAQGWVFTNWTGNATGNTNPFSLLMDNNKSVTAIFTEVGITVDPTSGLTTEAGGQAIFTLVLDTAPSANVTVTLTSNDTTEGTVAPSALTFTPTNWDQPKTLTVTGKDDNAADGSKAYSVIANPSSADANYNALPNVVIPLTNADNDTPGITMAPSTGLWTNEGERDAKIQFVLNTEPTSDVCLMLTSNDTSEGVVSPASYCFTPLNWNGVFTATITGVDDQIIDGDVTYKVNTISESTDVLYNAIPLQATLTNLDGPTIEWVSPVGNFGVYVNNKSCPVLFKIHRIGPEPAAKVRIYRYDAPTRTYPDIAEITPGPFEGEYCLDDELNPGFNQVFAVAYTTVNDERHHSPQPYIWFLHHRIFVPLASREQ